jgi:hypothetical protein
VYPKFLALLVSVSSLLAVAVGPGMSLVRCELTGKVQLMCCCGTRDVASSREQLEATDDCCQFAHLDASWQRSSLSSRANFSPPVSFALPSVWAVPRPRARGDALCTQVSTVAASPPPLWLSTKSLRV